MKRTIVSFKNTFTLNVLLTTFWILVWAIPCKAQHNDCFSSLLEANKSYNKGDLKDVLTHIIPCLNTRNYNADEVIQAYRLLALTYLAMNETNKADSFTKILLRKNHSYQNFPNLDDEKDFTKLVNSYDIIPKLFLGGQAGINSAMITHVVNYAIANTISSYMVQTNFFGGFLAEFNTSKNISIGANIHYSVLSYMHQLDNVAGWKQKYYEDLHYLSIPIYGKYNWPQKKIKPFVELGTEISFLQSVRAYIQSSDNTFGTVTNNAVNPLERRNNSNIGIFTGIGISYKLSGVNIYGSARYVIGFSNIIKSVNRYNDLNFTLKKQYVDDDFKLSDIQIAVGLSFPVLFKIKKNE